MQSKKYHVKSLALLLALGMYSTSAQASDLAIGVKAGTLGLGVEVTTNLVPLFARLRLQGNTFNYNTTITNTNVTYDTKLELASVGLLADIYPFAGKFRITGGAYYNANKLNMNAQQGGPVVIGGTVYNNPTVNTTVDFNKFAPYVGIGFGDAIASGSPIGFNVELGVLYQGTPQTTLTSNSVSAADLAQEKKQLDDALSNMKFYPVASVGVSWKF